MAGGGSPPGLGDGGPATSAQLFFPASVAVDSSGNLFIADTGHHRIRKVAAGTRIISTVAGTTTTMSPVFSGDGGPATDAELTSPGGVAVDASGNLFIADTDIHRIRKVDAATGIITTMVGTATRPVGLGGFGGDDGPASSAQLAFPAGLAIDVTGNLYISDQMNNRVRKVALAGSPAPPLNFAPTVLAPADGAALSVGSLMTFSWAAVPGVDAYLFEYTGPDLMFTNPRGTGPDPVNGVTPRGGAFRVGAASVSITITPLARPGTYRFRVAGLDPSGGFIGTFSDARTVIIPSPEPEGGNGERGVP